MRQQRKKESSPFALPAILAVVVLFLLCVRMALPLVLGPAGSAEGSEPPAPGTAAPVPETGSPAPETSAPPQDSPAPSAVPTPSPQPTPVPETSAPPQDSPAPSAVPTPSPQPTPVPTPAPEPGSIRVPEGISRELFGDCGKNADGSLSPSWYPGRADRDLETGEVTYRWDRWQSTLDTLAEYGAIYRKNADQDAVYLTFDCGYEMGYTGRILDTLKEKGIKAVFFCAGDFFEDERAPELLKRMVDEGHIIGNHTLHHPAMVYKSDSEFMEELNAIQEKVDAILGYHYPMAFYRPPEGATNERDLYLAREMGYTTVLWSFAYYDYNPQDQMAVDEALRNAKSHLHPGCVYLLHAVSETNTEMLGDLIDYIQGEGYDLRRIDQ